MATNQIGELSIKISVNSKEVDKGLKGTRKSLAETGKKLRTGANDWVKWGAAASAAAAVAGFAMVKSSLSTIKELKNTARAANTTVKEFQRGAFAAQQLGIETEKYGDILKDMNDRVGDFISTGAGPMVDFFEKIAPKVGVTADSFKGLSGQESLGLYVQSLEKANLSQAEMTFFMETMASDSTRLIPLFTENAKVLKDFQEQAKALGIGLSAIDVAKAAEAQKELNNIGQLFSAQLNKSVADLAPLISVIAKEFIGAANSGGGMANHVVSALGGVVKVVGILADGIRGIEVIWGLLKIAGLGAANVIAQALKFVADGVIGLVNTMVDGLKEVTILAAQASIGITGRVTKITTGLLGAASAMDDLKLSGSDLLDQFAAGQSDALSQAVTELNTLLAQPLPSTGYDEWLAGIKEKALLVGAEIAAAVKNETPVTDEGGGGQGENKEAERIRLENEGILEAMLEGAQMREETILGRLNREQEILDNALKNKLISQKEFNLAEKDLAKRGAKAKRDILTSGLGAIASALESGSKKSQKIGKKFAIANAVVHGYSAAVAAWDAGMQTGGPTAPIVAAAYTAASITKTAGIISGLKGSSSSSSSVSAGGGGAVSVPSGGGSGDGGGGATDSAAVERNISISLVGEGFSTEQVRALIGQINEQSGDGLTVSA